MKESLEFRRENRNVTAIDHGVVFPEAECIPRYNIYIIDNRVGDWNQKLLQDMIVNRDRMSIGMNQSEMGQKLVR